MERVRHGVVFSGVGAALVTVFDGNGEVDAMSTADVAAALADLGLSAVLVAGSTGEAPALDLQERTRLLDAVRKATPHIVLLAGTGASSVRQAVTFTRAACASGVDGIVALPPHGTSDLRAYYESVAAAAEGTPVLAYHYPAASSPGIPVGTLPDLPVDGIKDSSGDAGRLYEELDGFRGSVYIGSANLTFVAGALGCAGVILAIANVHPELATLAWSGDSDAQRRLARAARETLARRPQGLKDAVAARFGVSPVCRMG